jgi:hypothetical protein
MTLHRLFRQTRPTGNAVNANTAQDNAPETLSISLDRLRLILVNFLATVDKAGKWTTYAGAALSLWLSLAVSDFSTNKTRFGLSGAQWQLVFVVAASWGTIRALFGLAAYIRRPRLAGLISQIIENSDIEAGIE